MRASRRGGHAGEHASHERWLVSYADFVTLLFAFFVVLFASAHHDAQSIIKVSKAIRGGFQEMSASPDAASGASPVSLAEPAISAKTALDLAALEKQLHKALAGEIERKEVVLKETPEGFVISLREVGFFNSGDARLLPGAAPKIKRIGGILMQHGFDVRVEGHSDDVPIHTAAYNSNWELSNARAMAVLSLLLDESGFDPQKVSVAGYGQYRPVAANDSADGRRMNRRVDLVVVGLSRAQASTQLR